jgi:hypothetical protein
VSTLLGLREVAPFLIRQANEAGSISLTSQRQPCPMLNRAVRNRTDILFGPRSLIGLTAIASTISIVSYGWFGNCYPYAQEASRSFACFISVQCLFMRLLIVPAGGYVDTRDPSRRLITCIHCGFRLPIAQAQERLQRGTTVAYRMWCQNCWRDFEGLEPGGGLGRGTA